MNTFDINFFGDNITSVVHFKYYYIVDKCFSNVLSLDGNINKYNGF